MAPSVERSGDSAADVARGPGDQGVLPVRSNIALAFLCCHAFKKGFDIGRCLQRHSGHVLVDPLGETGQNLSAPASTSLSTPAPFI